uniref:Immunoglobulin V-set domain-containing protein n=1 Tax=Haplochromis burtoni TaxID=8153 RepID=A0A3Q2WHF5_HAPBU
TSLNYVETLATLMRFYPTEQKLVKLDKKTDLLWKFNYSNNIAKHVFNNDPVVFDNYEGRAELFGQNDSLLVKNVQHNDSGDYTAVTISGKEQKVAEYKVIVQVDPVSNSSDSCDLTVTCSTVDFNISSSFRCDGKNCSHAGAKNLKATKFFSSLIVYLQQDTIFCNHSNQVSWNETKKVPCCVMFALIKLLKTDLFLYKIL